MLLLIVILFSTNVFAIDFKFECESALAIAHLSATPPAPIVGDELTLGLPANQPRPEPGAVTLESDVGTTIWPDAASLRAWLDLGDVIADVGQAVALIDRITGESEYCPPGLNVDFCAHLRELYFADMARHNPEHHREDKIVITRDSSEDGKRRMANRDGLNLKMPWGLHPETLKINGIHSNGAVAVVAMMARENLLRHLRFKDHHGEFRTGDEVDMHSRMAVAMRPSLIGLMPLLLIRPIEATDGTMGNPKHPFGGLFKMVSRSFNLPGTGEKFIFEVRSTASKEFLVSLKAQFRVDKFLKDITLVEYPANLKFEREFAKIRLLLQDAAQTLSSARGVTPRVELEPVRPWSEFKGSGFINFTVEGLSEFDTLLLFYKFADLDLKTL